MMMLKRSRRRHHGPHGWGHRGRTNPTAMTIAGLLLHHSRTRPTYLPRRSPPLAIEVSSGRNWSVWRDCTLDKDPPHTHHGDLPPPLTMPARSFLHVTSKNVLRKIFPCLPRVLYTKQNIFFGKRSRKNQRFCPAQRQSAQSAAGSTRSKRVHRDRERTNERTRQKGIRTQREY